LAAQRFWKFLRQNYPDLSVVAVTGVPLKPERMWTFFNQARPVDFIYKKNIDLEDFQRRIQGRIQGVLPPVPRDWSSLQRQLMEARENLRIIQEHNAKFVLSTDVPLQFVKEERRLLDRIAELEQQLGAQNAEDSMGSAPKQLPSPVAFIHKYDVFISYNHQNSDWVRKALLPRLEREGLRVCVDYRDFEIGAPSLVNIENAVELSRKTLLVLTPDWIASQWTEFEALLIQTKDPAGRGRRILPLMVESCQLPDRLQVFTYLDLTNPGEFDFQMQRLVAAIRSTPLPPAPAEPISGQKQITPPSPLARDFNYELGLAALGKLLAQADVETRLSFAVLESRLRDNLSDERLYGGNETIRADRARIVHELNRLALAHTGRSFNELCAN
jgi:hypothetical protein